METQIIWFDQLRVLAEKAETLRDDEGVTLYIGVQKEGLSFRYNLDHLYGRMGHSSILSWEQMKGARDVQELFDDHVERDLHKLEDHVRLIEQDIEEKTKDTDSGSACLSGRHAAVGDIVSIQRSL